jgi:hypothetical protein
MTSPSRTLSSASLKFSGVLTRRLCCQRLVLDARLLDLIHEDLVRLRELRAKARVERVDDLRELSRTAGPVTRPLARKAGDDAAAFGEREIVLADELGAQMREHDVV